MIFRNNFYENNKRRRGDDIEHELRFKLLLTYVCNRYFFLSIPLIKLFQLWKMQEGRRISGTKFIRNSCAKRGTFFTRVFHRDSFFPPFFEEKKSRYEWTNVATMSRGISARNNTARTNQRYPLLCTRQPSKKLRNIQRILGKREERERGTAEKTGKKKLRWPRINEI